MFATTWSRRRLAAVIAGALLIVGFGAGPALAQTDPYLSDDPYVSDDGQDRGPVGQGTGVGSEQVVRGDVQSSSLPITGGEALTLALVGGGLLAAGVGAVVVGRRGRPDTL